MVKAYWPSALSPGHVFLAHRLDIDIGTGDLVDETTFSDIRVATDQERPGVRVDSWQTRDVLPDLLEIGQRVLLSLHDCRHSTECGSLELFTSVQRVSKLEESDIVFCDLGDEMTSGVQLPQSKLVVVLVVQNVEQRGEEGVEVLPVSSSPRRMIESSRRGWGTRK